LDTLCLDEATLLLDDCALFLDEATLHLDDAALFLDDRRQYLLDAIKSLFRAHNLVSSLFAVKVNQGYLARKGHGGALIASK
jgi:hypothetical protein